MKATLHKECLPENGWRVFHALKDIVIKYKGVLAGGTALSFQIGHRLSVDLDFFTNKDFSTDSLISAIRKTGLNFRVVSEGEDFLVAEVLGVKFSLFHYAYPFIAPIKYKDVLIAGILDIAAMKLIAVSQRGTKRDFVDLYFILQTTPFYKIADHMVRRFGKERVNPIHIGKALMFFPDADSNPDPVYIGGKVKWETIKKFFKQYGKQFVLDMDAALKTQLQGYNKL